MATVTYNGPPHQQCFELSAETGATLEPGASYNISDELAERLVASSAHFTLGEPVLKPATKAQLLKRAAELGLQVAKTANRDAIAAAVAAAEDAAAAAEESEPEDIAAAAGDTPQHDEED